MELTPTLWLGFGIGLVFGAACIFVLQRRIGGGDRERAEQLASELEETREELEAHREEVAKHFHETSQLFRGLTEQYTRLYAHLAGGAREFCADDEPALARGFDGPLLGRNGDDAGRNGDDAGRKGDDAGEETAPPSEAAPVESRPEQGNGSAPPLV